MDSKNPGRIGEEIGSSPPPPERKAARPWSAAGGLAVKVAISTAILVYLLSHVPLGDIGDALVGVQPLYLVLGLAAIPVTGFLVAAQQKVLTDLQGLRLSVMKIAEVNLIIRFYGLILPGPVAGLIRWHRFAQPTKKPAEALAAVIFNRGLDLIVVVALGLVFWLWARPPDVSPLLSLLMVAMLGGLLLVQSAIFNRHVTGWTRRLLESGRMRLIPRVARVKIAKAATAAAVFDALPKKTLAYMVGLVVSRQLITVLALVLFARAIGIDLLFTVAGWIDAFLHILLIIPISVAGLGVREAGLVISLQTYGVSPADALALSMILLGKKILRAGFGGILEIRHVLLRPARYPREMPRTGVRAAIRSRNF